MASGFIFELLRLIERLSARGQGKGYGTTSVGAEVKCIEKLLRSSDLKTCVDIGGNIGNYTEALSILFPAADIYTFEPCEVNIAKLQERFAARKNIRIVPFAVSDMSGEAVLYSDAPGSGLGSLTKRNLDHIGLDFETTETVKTVRFEDFWQNEMGGCDIDILKLAIEGHELAALKSCGDALRHTKIIQFEFGSCNIDTRTYFRDFWHLFGKLGFTIYRISPIGVMPIKKYKERDEFFSTTNYLALRS